MQSQVAVPEFTKVPRCLNIEVQIGSFVNYCGVVMGDHGKLVLVALVRNRGARPDVPYTPPGLDYLADTLSVHSNVVRANLQWELPRSEDELRLLVTGLSKES